MKKNLRKIILFLTVATLAVGCGNDKENHTEHEHDHDEHEEEHADEVHLSELQFGSMDMQIDTLSFRSMGEYIEANGQLEVPPQNEAIVTAIVGGNVKSIKVIEGDKVKKGQVLAYLSHPDLIDIQMEYAGNWNELKYLETDYLRQEKLHAENIGSGKEFQKAKSEFLSMKSRVRGTEAQLNLMSLNVQKIQQGQIYTQIPVKSPINGYIRLVEVKMAQYVQPQTEMFEIVNIDEIHADLMVFEKDMHKVKEGQMVKFSVGSNPDEELEAVIYSIGKAFEQDPKALHLHADIKEKNGFLLPGMYINAKISTSTTKSLSIPEAGVVKEGDKHFIFIAEKESESDVSEWGFKPLEVQIGVNDNGWVEIKLLKEMDKGVQVALNNAYYLMAEMKKGEAEHTH